MGVGRRAGGGLSAIPSGGELAALFDAHLHTEFAYCAEDTSISGALERVRTLGLAGAGFSEHLDQLYFPAERFWDRPDNEDLRAIRRSVAAGHSRLAAYRARLEPLRSGRVRMGLEVGARDGRLAILDEDRGGWDYLIGAVHNLDGLDPAAAPYDQVVRRFMAKTRLTVRCGVDVLGHPFRYFRRFNLPVPVGLYRPLADLLADAGVAAEVNFHTNRPDPEFFALCLDRGVRLSVGSDAHALAEVGDLRPHLELLRRLGAADRLGEVLWRPALCA